MPGISKAVLQGNPGVSVNVTGSPGVFDEARFVEDSFPLNAPSKEAGVRLISKMGILCVH
jgi:hypothetical protein